MDKKLLLEKLRYQKFPEKIIKAFEKVKREEFVPKEYQHLSYENFALPLVKGATISQPSTIAFMLDKLELKKDSKQKVLEIGSGSGYVLSLINQITKGKTYGIEIISELAEISSEKLKSNKQIKIISGSGKNGLPQFCPYDRILISAAASEIPYHLTKQLKKQGIIVSAVKDSICKIKKEKGKISVKEFHGFVFVPFTED